MIVDQFINGTALRPGTTYYVKIRYRDVHGNLTLPSAATSFQLRYTDEHPGARVFRTTADGDPGTSFQDLRWSPYPFLSTATGVPGYFDVYNNYHYGVGFGTLPAFDTPSSCGFFQMPCNGLCRVQARIGLQHNGTGKNDIYVRFGLFRLNSNLPGGNASTPIIPFYIGTREGHNPQTPATTFFVGTTSSSLFVNLSGEVSASSGDWIAIGVYPEDTGASPAIAIGNSSGSRSFAHFSVIQD